MVELSKKKTVILATHQISYLYDCDKVLILDDGEIVHNDEPENLRK